MLAVAWPFGSAALFADTGGAKTRYAQTMRAIYRVSAHLAEKQASIVGKEAGYKTNLPKVDFILKNMNDGIRKRYGNPLVINLT